MKMEDFTIQMIEGSPVITHIESGLVVKVRKGRIEHDTDSGVLLEATQYIAKDKVFVRECEYRFEAHSLLTSTEPISKDTCYGAIRFFFHMLLDTEYFVIGIPRCSTLYVDPSPVHVKQ